MHSNWTVIAASLGRRMAGSRAAGMEACLGMCKSLRDRWGGSGGWCSIRPRSSRSGTAASAGPVTGGASAAAQTWRHVPPRGAHLPGAWASSRSTPAGSRSTVSLSGTRYAAFPHATMVLSQVSRSTGACHAATSVLPFLLSTAIFWRADDIQEVLCTSVELACGAEETLHQTLTIWSTFLRPLFLVCYEM